MSRKVEYYCDCCKKQVKNESELSMIEVTFGSNEGITHREVCFDCWKEYTDRMIEVGKELFESKSKKDIEKEDIKTEKDQAEFIMVISFDENEINEVIKEFNLVMQEIELRLKRGIEEFKESIKTTAYQNID